MYYVAYSIMGYMVALIFVAFFTKILVVKLSSGENKIEIKSDKPFSFLPLFKSNLLILANANAEVASSLKVIFQLKDCWVLLLSGLFWPISLAILSFMAYGAIFGKQLPPNGSESE